MSIAKSHQFGAASTHGMAISGLLQSHYLRYCAQVVPAKAVDLLNAVLGSDLANMAQARRLEEHYGRLPSVEQELHEPLTSKELQLDHRLDPVLPAQERLYAMFDGGMLLYNSGYQEVKVGRVFRGSQIVASPSDDEQGDQRNRVLNSEYLVREGHYSDFVSHFAKLIKAQQEVYPLAPLIVVTDGATWMRNWVAEAFPKAEHILDFYHAYEHLCEFATLLIGKEAERTVKLEKWKKQLKEGEVKSIIREVKMYSTHPKGSIVKAAAELLTYLTNNISRMQYRTYRDKGYLTGSGAIESAVSSVVQQRCKLNGQRWDNGAQPVLNLRSIYCSSKGRRMEKIINDQYQKVA
ncbi:MAG: hypothetical protein ACI8Q1_001461 [Parvicella sp.]